MNLLDGFEGYGFFHIFFKMTIFKIMKKQYLVIDVTLAFQNRVKIFLTYTEILMFYQKVLILK